MAKRTKIVCTLGPAVDNETTLKSLILAGMDVARLNLSHGNRESHSARIARLKKVRRELDEPTAILLDTRGPEIRTGDLESDTPIRLFAGKQIVLDHSCEVGNARRIGQSCATLHEHVQPGTSIVLDHGLIELAVDEVCGTDIICTVQNAGTLAPHRALNLPEVDLGFSALTDRDREDLLFGIAEEVDFVSLSSVRSAADVLDAKKFLADHGGASISLLAKIENADAVAHIDEILEAADGAMIARGDLGVEMPESRVPHVQKDVIRACNRAAKPVITATQMLDSMMRNPRPTRAEAADVANAIYDGTDAISLSGETAIGKYPVPAVRMMARIAESTEPYVSSFDPETPKHSSEALKVALAVRTSAVETANAVGADCIIAPTTSGRTPRLISNLRPKAPVYAVTASEYVMRMLQLYWGVSVIRGDVEGDMSSTIHNAHAAVCDRGLLKPGALAVLTAGDRETAPQWPPSEGDPMSAPTNVVYVVKTPATDK